MSLGPMLAALLAQAGLESLTNWASNLAIHGATEAEIELDLYNQPAFKNRFKAIEARRQAGMSPISINDYLNFEASTKAMAATIGMPLDQNEIDSFLINDVSAKEVDDRMQIAAQAAMSDTNTRSWLMSNFDISAGQIMKYWMDPKKEYPVLEQQFRMGLIGGAASRTGFGTINTSQAQRLASIGMEQDAAASGFANLAHMASLFTPISGSEQSFTTDDQISLLTGDQEVTKAVEQQQRGRQAEFAGGGSYAAGQEGFSTGTAK